MQQRFGYVRHATGQGIKRSMGVANYIQVMASPSQTIFLSDLLTMNMQVVGLADKASAMLGKELAEHDLSVVETSFGRSLRTEKHLLLGCALFLHPCVLQSAYADEFLRTCVAQVR